ncbi:MAG: HEAT repeat domain-containing protein [Verrucomicrobia bacterium]|nr:HEAT repeat domain-containing protein [Verrucomicrobiota bacterium]
MNWLFEVIAPISRILAEHLVNGLLLSAAIYLAFRILRPLFLNGRRGSAATSHRVLSLVFVALAITPILSCLQPVRLSMNGPGQQPPPVSVAAPGPPEPSIFDGQIQETLLGEPGSSQPVFFGWVQTIDWPVIVAAVWAGLACVLLVRLLLALNSLWTLHCRVRILVLPESFTSRRRIQLAESALVQAPVAIGLWAPKVLLPSALAAQYSSDDWNRVLRHEIAHLERYDDWSNFFQRLLMAFNPFNSFLWLVGNELRLVREIVCDDWVVAESRHAKSYAQLLTRLAVASRGSPVLASGVSRTGRQLYRRVARILDPKCDRKLKPSWVTTTLAAVGLLGTSAAGICWLPAITWISNVQAQDAGPSPEPSPSAPVTADALPDHGQVTKKETADPEIIALLKNSALNDGDPRVRGEAARSLVTINSEAATEALLQLLDESKEDRIKVFILRTLSHRRSADARVRAKLSEFAAKNQSLQVRLAALDQLAKNADPGTVDQFISIYRSANELPIKETCLRGLAAIESKPARDFLIATAKEDPDPDLRRVALSVLVGPPGGDRRIMIIRRDGGAGVTIQREDLDNSRGDFDGLNCPDETGEPEMLMPPPQAIPGGPRLGPKFGAPMPPLPPFPDGPELQPNVQLQPKSLRLASASRYKGEAPPEPWRVMSTKDALGRVLALA